jgi:hypothetical protein
MNVSAKEKIDVRVAFCHETFVEEKNLKTQLQFLGDG